MKEVDTHNLIVDFGKHKGERWTRLPVGYLKWLANGDGKNAEIARAELARRGTLLDASVEISGHAIDRASLNCRKIWHETALSPNEGLRAWLHRVATEALKEFGEQENIVYNGMKLVFIFGEIYPTLKTVMPKKRKHYE